VEKLCWLYVLVTPVMLWQPAASRMRLGEGVFVAAAACFVWQLVRRQRRLEWPRSPFALCVGLYVLVSAISIVNSPVPGRSLLELGGIVYLASLYPLFINVIRTREGLWAIVEVWLVATALVVAVGFVGLALVLAGMKTRIAQAVFVGPFVPFRIPRVFSTMVTAKLLASHLVLGLPLALARLRVERLRASRRTMLLLIGGMAVTLFLTFSREWVSALVALVVVWLCTGAAPKRRFLRLAALSAIAVLFLAVQLVSAFVFLDLTTHRSALPGRPIGPQIVDSYDPQEGAHRWQLSVDYLWADYLTLKWVAWTMIREHPWIGAGVGTFQSYLSQRRSEGSIYRRFTDYEVPHSTIFGKAAETGLIGLGVLGALFGAWIAGLAGAVRQAIQESDRWLGAALLAGVAGLLISSPNIDLMNFRYLWTALALGMVVQEVIGKTAGGSKGEGEYRVGQR
jgi:hypothetical protein